MAEIVDLHEYYQECNSCGGISWLIQYTRDCQEIKQIVCDNPDCTMILENPGLDSEISFKPDFEINNNRKETP